MAGHGRSNNGVAEFALGHAEGKTALYTETALGDFPAYSFSPSGHSRPFRHLW